VEYLSLTVDQHSFNLSVHGEAGLTCVDCHTGYDGYPHPSNAFNDLRDFQVEHYTLCRDCHLEQYDAQLDSTHARALAGGRREAAICTDCHGAHDVTPPDQPANRIPQTCGNCHGAIYEQYAASVHGAALLAEANPDVPTCVDCHGMHTIADPLLADFRLSSPDICADCHGDAELMEPYGISPDVVSTYVKDFHGTVVTLFEPTNGQPVDQAVCSDCHGVHDIAAVDSPDSHVIRENLLATCQQCHPDAGEHFIGAWASHYIPSQEHNPFVYRITNSYSLLLWSVGGLLALVFVTDIVGWLRRLLRKDRP
jgi:predicted CXXCH cytochrome family protein